MENQNIDIDDLFKDSQLLIQTVYKVADRYDSLSDFHSAQNLRDYAKIINNDVDADHSEMFFKNFHFEQDNSYKNNETGQKLGGFILKSTGGDDKPILFINITERGITNSDLLEPMLSSNTEIKINHDDDKVIHAHFFNHPDDAYNNFIQQKNFLTSVEHHQILNKIWEEATTEPFEKKSVSELVAKFKEDHPESLFEIQTTGSFLSYEKNKQLIDIMSNLKPDTLAEAYDDLSPSKAAYSFLWNDCIYLNESQSVNLSIRDLWEHMPNHIQKEIIEAVFSEKTLKNNNGITLKEYAEKSVWGEEENSSYLPKVYQVSDSKTKETLSIGLDLAEANDSFKKLSGSNKHRPKLG